MKPGGVLLGILSFAASVVSAPEPFIAWERSITAFGASAIFPDHLGRIAVVGATSNRPGIFLFAINGEVVASAATCSPRTNAFLAPNAVGDKAGRIFLIWPVRCVSFEPGLTAMSRLGGWDATSDTFRSAVPDETGGVYGGFRYSSGGLSYVDHFTCGDERQYFRSDLTGDDTQALVARAPSGNVYLVGSRGWARYSPLQIIAYTASGEVLWNKSLGPPPNEFASAAACDSQGNLLIAGTHRDNGGPGQWGFRPFLLKVNLQGDILWRSVLYGSDEGGHGALAVNSADEIFVTGRYGTLKYSPAGGEIWRNLEPAYQLRASPHGEVVVGRTLSERPMVLKLTESGNELWRRDEPFRDFAIDDDGSVFVASIKWFQPSNSVPSVPGETIIRRYIEDFAITDTKAAIDVPSVATCEPFSLGPCDVAPPPPPAPPAEVTMTRLPLGKMLVCWPTNYSDYRLEATRHVNARHPDRTRWHPVRESCATNAGTCCVTAKILRYGKTFRIVPP
jgi:hypothetical protein